MDNLKLEKYQHQYTDMLLDGETSKRSYIRLLEEDDFVLAIRPVVQVFPLSNNKVVLLGCKLRVTFAEDSPMKEESPKQCMGNLLTYTELDPAQWGVIAADRVSKVYANQFLVPEGEEKEFYQATTPSMFAKGMLAYLEETTGKKVQNPLRVNTALRDYYAIELPDLLGVEVEEKSSGVVLSLVKDDEAS